MTNEEIRLKLSAAESALGQATTELARTRTLVSRQKEHDEINAGFIDRAEAAEARLAIAEELAGAVVNFLALSKDDRLDELRAALERFHGANSDSPPVRTAEPGRAERIAALLKKRTWYIEARVGPQNHRGDLVHFIDDYRCDDGARGYINLPAEEYVAGLLVDLADARAGAADIAEPQVALQIVHEQAEDPGLWFVAEHVTEAYLQQELHRLHAAVEGGADMAEGERRTVIVSQGLVVTSEDLQRHKAMHVPLFPEVEGCVLAATGTDIDGKGWKHCDVPGCVERHVAPVEPPRCSRCHDKGAIMVELGEYAPCPACAPAAALHVDPAKAARRKKALEWLAAAPELPPCLNCGRIVLIGRCCDSPSFAPAAAPSTGPPAGSFAHDVEQADRAGKELAAAASSGKRGHDFDRDALTAGKDTACRLCSKRWSEVHREACPGPGGAERAEPERAARPEGYAGCAACDAECYRGCMCQCHETPIGGKGSAP